MDKKTITVEIDIIEHPDLPLLTTKQIAREMYLMEIAFNSEYQRRIHVGNFKLIK